MPPAAAKSKISWEKIADIQRALSAMEHLSSGTLLKRMKICGTCEPVTQNLSVIVT
jgi:hypothetical protein